MTADDLAHASYDVHVSDKPAACDRCERLEAQLAEAEQDAARYRWVRDEVIEDAVWRALTMDTTGARWDAIIDKARRKR